jgi:hypothetical protein
MRSTKFMFLAGLLALAGCGSPSAPNNSHGAAAIASKKAEAPAEKAVAPENTPSNPNATFKGCWMKEGKNHYQAVDVSVGVPGTYPFNGYLYYGTSCNPKTQADWFGYNDITFGDFGYTFWFTRFANQKNMSALWYVGTDRSVCVNYETAPSC